MPLNRTGIYRASTAAPFAAAAGTAPFFVIQGSASTILHINKIIVSGATLTAVAYADIQVAKYSTAPSGGTATALTMVPMDSTSAAATAALCSVYTVAPTAGTKVGDIGVRRILGQATTAAAAGDPVDYTIHFDDTNDAGVVLRGVAQGVALYFAGAPATAVTMSLVVEWSEE